MIILPPQAEYCDCIYDFILTILNQKPDQLYTDLCSDNQQERCQLNECNVVKNFRIPIRSQPAVIPSIDESIIDNNQDLVTTHPLPTYVHRHPSDKHHIDSNLQVIMTRLSKSNLHIFIFLLSIRIHKYQHLKRILHLIPMQFPLMIMMRIPDPHHL
jgi:hypothetical protein